MLHNLEKIRKQKGVSLVDIADLLHIRYQTVREKINGDSDFKFGEAVKVKYEFSYMSMVIDFYCKSILICDFSYAIVLLSTNRRRIKDE